MAAASYYSGRNAASQTEVSLENEARQIEGEIVWLQACIRGFLRRVPTDTVRMATGAGISSPTRRDRVEASDKADDQAQWDSTHQGQTRPRERPMDWASQAAQATLQDPDVVEKKIDDLPEGWLSAWTQDGNPFYVDTKTSISTWTHPRQADAQKLYGSNFQLHLVWKEYFNHYDTPSASEIETPTIGELALYYHAADVIGESPVMSHWWRNNPGGSPLQSACEVCRHINFDALLHTTNAWGPTRAIPLGSLSGVAKKTHCAFCRLVIRAVDSSPGTLEDDISEGGQVVRCSLISNQQWSVYSSTIRPLYVQFKLPWQTDAGPESLIVRKFHQILLGEAKPPEQKHNDSRIVKDEIDMELVKSWLRSCEQNHQDMRMQHNAIHPSFTPPKVENMHLPSILIRQPCTPVSLSDDSLKLTLIDVHQECLVIIDNNARYVALSYVWGGPQPFQNTKARMKQLYTPGSISSENGEIPLTIRDAIRLVSRLGERYLWIDSLCIVQDSSPEKMEQIANMGNIYSRAVLTLVAANGSSCHAGLPGVRPGSRTSFQHTEKVNGMLLATELLDIHHTVDPSIWNTRGWTYQERELSKRYLYFTDSCVYFSCNQMLCKEDCGLRDVSRLSDKGHRIRAEKHPVWNNYRRAVKNFTKRELSFEEDVVNAFEGIVSLLQPAFKCNFLYGLPETELDLALLWQPSSDLRRRVSESTGQPAFPSWSWAGWVGEVDYVWTPHLVDDYSRVKWQIQSTGSEEYLTSDQLRSPKAGDHGRWVRIQPSEGAGGEAPYYYQPEQPGIWCLHPTAAKDVRRSLTLLRPKTHELRFKALTALLRIVAKPHIIKYDDYDQLSSCRYYRHVRCPVEILSADGFVTGTVYVPAQWMKSLANEPREFICLSRRRSYYADTAGTNVYNAYEENGTYPQLENDLREAHKRPTLYPKQDSKHHGWDRYDHSRFNPYKPWPLYNVMMVERKGDLAYRVAIGIVHVTAFMQADPIEQLVTLA